VPKAYWIAHVTITDPDPYALYAKEATQAFIEYGARTLARGGHSEQLEGKGKPRNVVIEFASLKQALACYHSEKYQAARKHRESAGEAEILIVEGV
jgi:uncharacterized protein (DUF1330 family)